MDAYTDGDVQRLVDFVKTISEDHRTSLAGSHWSDLKNALKPFHPDPDADLIEKINELRKNITPSVFDIRTRAIIAAVREHDRGKR